MKLKIETNKLFRMMFIVGIALIYVSFFLEWYYFEVYDAENQVLASWSYNPIFGWRSSYESDYGLNEILKPQDLGFSFPLIVVVFVSGGVSLYAVLFKDLEKQEVLEKLKSFSQFNFFLPLLVVYIVVSFPVSYLFANELYFPFLVYQEFSSELTYLYLIGPGYILFSLSFVCIMPYTIFYYRIVAKFQTKKNIPEAIIERQINEIDSSFDFKRICAEEHVMSDNKTNINKIKVRNDE